MVYGRSRLLLLLLVYPGSMNTWAGPCYMTCFIYIYAYTCHVTFSDMYNPHHHVQSCVQCTVYSLCWHMHAYGIPGYSLHSLQLTLGLTPCPIDGCTLYQPNTTDHCSCVQLYRLIQFNSHAFLYRIHQIC